MNEREAEKAGWGFVERFADEVSQGRPEDAFEWVSENHKRHHYLGWDRDEVIAITRGQLLDAPNAA